MYLKKLNFGDWRDDQRLRALASLPEVLSSIPRRLIAPQFQPDWGGWQARDKVFLLSIGAFF